MPRLSLVFACVIASSCTCQPGKTVTLEPARLVAAPASIDVPATWVGQRTSATLELSNLGGVTAVVDVSVAAPFSVDVSQLELARGETRTLTVSFSPSAAGRFSDVLHLGAELDVPVSAEGLEVPMCQAASACSSAQFDFASAQCVMVQLAEGTACETSCVTGGACVAGECRGALRSCADTDACTVDGCSETGGCSHTPRVCPMPSGACQVARCDAAQGCLVEDAPDGVLCGADDCAATEVDVCILGQCTRRPRPQSGRCVNTWVPTSIPARHATAMVFDAARQRLVLFGGAALNNAGQMRAPRSDTWEWDGVKWEHRIPAGVPPPRFLHAMAWDAARQRVVLFGGRDESSSAFGDTWEWDGTTWVARVTAVSPPPRFGHVMAYDPLRRRVVLFGGRDADVLGDTWEWDGATWTQRAPVTSPPGRAFGALAWDGTQLVLFGGFLNGAPSAETWVWDGTTWSARSPAASPTARRGHALAFDVVRQRLLLFGGLDVSQYFDDTWEWDGATWARLSPAAKPSVRGNFALAYDPVRRRTMLFGGNTANTTYQDTWEFDGASWAARTALAPPARSHHRLAYDSQRQRVVLFGGLAYGSAGSALLADTWEWDGSSWVQRSPASAPPGRSTSAMAYDASRQRTLLFGGFGTAPLGDTWEWDGTTWTQRTPATSPAARDSHAMVYDEARQRVVLFGGGQNGGNLNAETWEWDGTTWSLRTPPTSPPPRGGHALVWDATKQRVLLFGGFDPSALGDVWEWDGVTWTEVVPASAPTARYFHVLAWDTARQRALLFGGVDLTGLREDTWEWDGAAWSPRAPATAPSHNGGAAGVYDAARQRVTMFGGGNSNTWRFVP